MDIFNESLDELYRNSKRWKIPCEVSRKLKIKPGQAVLYLMGILYALMILGVFENLICDLLTFVFPARWTLLSISSPNFSSDKLWVTYWIVYSLLKVIDEIFPIILQFIPFFYAIKATFLLALCAPATKGGLILYNLIFSHLMKDLKRMVSSSN
jgi:hypothetical protein